MGKLGQFAVALTEALQDHGKNMRWLARECDLSYEHVRKLCRSLAFPSQDVARKIARALSMHERGTWLLVVADKIEHKYGVAAPQTGKSARVQAIERFLPRLSEQQFDDLVVLLRLWARHARGGVK